MNALKIILTALGIFKALVNWFRDKSIHDAGRNAERLEMREAEAKANAESEKVVPVNPHDIVNRLRDAGEEF